MDSRNNLNAASVPPIQGQAPAPASAPTPRPPAARRPGADAAGDFAQVLGDAQQATAGQTAAPARPPVSRWRSLGFLTSQPAGAARSPWPWTHPGLDRALAAASTGFQAIVDAVAPYLPQLSPPASVATPAPAVSAAASPAVAPSQRAGLDLLPPTRPLALSDYPHPPGDNGRGIHWIPTVSQSPEVVDRFVNEAVEMGMKWVVFLNDGTGIGANDYLVKRLTEAGIEPLLRVYTPGLVPIHGDLQAMVRHYAKLGVRYFQLYNEPNLMVETGGQPPNVDQYLDLWVPAARQVIEAGGLPGFGALSPQGEMDDREFLRQSLERLAARGQSHLLDRSWLAMHNYTGPRPLGDPDGFLRFQQYDAIIRAALGRSLPIIGTEGGTHTSAHVSEAQQVAMMTGAYEYMQQREPYNFAYTYWIIANGHDPAWDEHALIRPDGPTALAQALKSMAAGGMLT